MYPPVKTDEALPCAHCGQVHKPGPPSLYRPTRLVHPITGAPFTKSVDAWNFAQNWLNPGGTNPHLNGIVTGHEPDIRLVGVFASCESTDDLFGEMKDLCSAAAMAPVMMQFLRRYQELILAGLQGGGVQPVLLFSALMAQADKCLPRLNQRAMDAARWKLANAGEDVAPPH